MKDSNHAESPGTPIDPPVCPACKSVSVTTTAKRPDADSYWRCDRCGEVWNVGRRREPNGRMSWR